MTERHRPMNGRYPKRFEDDGTNVTVDLHGCSIADALHVVRRSLQEGSRRGRARVVVIHGLSMHSGAGRTIKTELERRLRDGSFDAWMSGSTQDESGGRTTLWLKIGGSSDRRPIKVGDVVRP